MRSTPAYLPNEIEPIYYDIEEDFEPENKLGTLLKKVFPKLLKDQLFENNMKFVIITHPVYNISIYEWFRNDTKLSVLKDFAHLFFQFDQDFKFIDRQYEMFDPKPEPYDDSFTLKDVVDKANEQHNYNLINSAKNSNQIVLTFKFVN